ncbi:MAG: metallophosphoesterase [Gammaproteobacteria bacterium]|nr:metallophosphoesterase [Gammaproteobacteria bacterium]
MKLQFASDLHLEFRAKGGSGFVGGAPLQRTDADVIVLAGDIAVGTAAAGYAAEVAEEHGKPVILVPGNHEYYGGEYANRHQELRLATERHADVHFLAPGAVELAGVRFLGATLWTDFGLFGDPITAMEAAMSALSDFVAIRVGDRLMAPSDQLAMHRKELADLRQALATPFTGATVVITHHAPAWDSVAPQYRRHELTPAFVSELDAMVAECGAVLWVHGHTHGSFDYRLGCTRVVCNAGGYPRESSIGPWLPAYRPDWVIDLGGAP